jgi:hypothetical protein
MGKKLTLFMLDDSATGRITIEIGNWSGKAVFGPRGSLKSLLNRDEFDKPGVYLLKSETESPEYNDSIYIGESGKLRRRLEEHIRQGKDFESVICFISTDDMLTTAHIKYLESRLLSLAKDASSSKVENKVFPNLPRLSEADESDMEYFLENIKLVLPTVGVRSLVPSVRTPDRSTAEDSSATVYQLRSKTLDARMIEADDGFVVLEGSEASMSVSESMSEGWKRLRNKLLESGNLVSGDGKYVVMPRALGFLRRAPHLRSFWADNRPVRLSGSMNTSRPTRKTNRPMRTVTRQGHTSPGVIREATHSDWPTV